MSRRAIAATVLALCLWAGHEVYSQGAGAQCAFVAEVSGKAVVQKGAKYFRLDGMNGVYCGEKVKVLAGGRVVVARCADNIKVEVEGPAEFTVTDKGLVFKSGSARNPTSLKPDLCPFFMEQAFAMVPSVQVDAGGNDLPRRDEHTGAMPAPCPPPPFYFNGYLTEVSGEVYFARPAVARLTGDFVPGEQQVLLGAGGGVTVFSCDEGKKYRVEGPALLRFSWPEPDQSPVVFINGAARTVGKADAKQCAADREKVMALGRRNVKPVGLDGTTK